MTDPVIHFEIPADDLARAQAFYQDCFGWETRDVVPNRLVLVSTTATDPKSGMPLKPGSINGDILARTGPIRAPLVTLNVKDIEAAFKAIEQNGGKRLLPANDVGPGLAAYFQDSEGNVMGLFQPKPAK